MKSHTTCSKDSDVSTRSRMSAWKAASLGLWVTLPMLPVGHCDELDDTEIAELKARCTNVSGTLPRDVVQLACARLAAAAHPPYPMAPRSGQPTLIVSGLAFGSSVGIQNGFGSMTVPNGSFSVITGGAGYNLVIARQPAGQTCTIADGPGTTPATSIPIKVNCSGAYSIGGTVSGVLPGANISLTANTGESLRLDSNGPFKLPNLRLSGYQYGVGIDLEPDRERCKIEHETGTLGSADVTDIKIECALDPALDGVTLGAEDPDMVDIPNPTVSAQDEPEQQCETRGKRVELRPGTESWFLTDTCGGSGGQPIYLRVGTATEGPVVLGDFGSGFIILHTRTNGMADVTAIHGSDGAVTYRFDGKKYQASDH